MLVLVLVSQCRRSNRLLCLRHRYGLQMTLMSCMHPLVHHGDLPSLASPRAIRSMTSLSHSQPPLCSLSQSLALTSLISCRHHFCAVLELVCIGLLDQSVLPTHFGSTMSARYRMSLAGMSVMVTVNGCSCARIDVSSMSCRWQRVRGYRLAVIVSSYHHLRSI